MAEIKLPRLLAAAKEFNIGQETLIDFLTGKGFAKDELKPTSKLTEDMYFSLQQEFSSDKAAKAKSDQIEIPKGNAIEGRKKKDEEEILFRKEGKKKPAEKEVPVTAEIPAAPVPEPEAAPVQPPVPEIIPSQPEITKIEAPEIEGPKILDKIDLSTIDSSTRPKKSVKKKVTEAVPEEKPEAAKEETPVVEEVVPEVVASAEPKIAAPEVSPADEAKEEESPVIENIRAEKLEGPRIVGRITLPVNTESRPASKPQEEKRKRKRIPIEKRDQAKPRQDGDQNRPQQRREGTRPPIQKQGDRKDNKPQAQGGATGGGRFGHGRPGDKRRDSREVKEIDAKEIQDKIRETQAKLAGSSRGGKSTKSKMRRARREEAEHLAGEAQDDNKLQVTEFVTVSELANLMDVSFAEVIGKCMGLGIMVSINQRLDAEVIELVAGEFGFEVEFIGIDDVDEDENEEIEEQPENLQPRAPVITIMGHVDHGKTSLLDYIRSAKVVAGEAGGITQHMGAYQVTIASGKKLTFLDTPGHEAFTAMRARGAKAADVAIIVIAADDAVMPQTREAISHAQAAGLPMIFAINKIDKEGATPEKIKEQLSAMNILVEDWGGKYQSQEISAKTGLNVDVLLEKILLEAELLDLKANPQREATGTIIEASLDKGRGFVATMLVQSGTLHQGDIIVSGQFYGRIKAMFNERNQRLEEAGPSSPVQILGLNGAPQAGEKFKVYPDESEAKNTATRRAQILREQGIRAKKHITLDEIGRRLALGNFKELNLIIKGDVDGSVEALSDSLQKLSTEEIAVSVVHKAVGAITESDVLLAAASDAIIVGFNVRPSIQAARLAEKEGVEIKAYSIIYNAIEELKSAMEGMMEPTITEKIIANVEIREVYKFDKATVAGCQVLDGKISRNSKVRLIRDGIVIYPTGEGQSAELGSLKRYKDDVKDVSSGMECGLTLKNYNDLKAGDVVEAFEIEEVKRSL
ncbi:translation initiation factor IF-2 [Agriterribacter sp.]|uniref:translation initiation factor IF-2 n=1 Tax=Agriterribacter sp. TaxID=2821509 RepID=UPI002C5F0641|nr:translation initiation factor IF-2 [Agriterribacter sp.]HTN08606.1 translation initiation factor IF-2 [Agriterribacter sp.]